MPELCEVEFYRRLAEYRARGRVIAAVDASDGWFLKGGTTADALNGALVGTTIDRIRRIGKLLLLDTRSGDVVGLRFGMTGTLGVDGHFGVDDMQYGSNRHVPEWNRFSLTYVDGGDLVVNDPRRLGGVILDPDESVLGPDALAVTTAELDSSSRSKAPVKTWLMDQANIAGIGNLLADEILWRAGLDPARVANGLSAGDRRRLAGLIPRTVVQLIDRGGSHRGDLMPERTLGGRCPKDRTPLDRRKINGRTTFSCPKHQQ